MDIVTKYLHIAIDLPGAKAFHIPMMLKLECLRNELEILVRTTNANEIDVEPDSTTSHQRLGPAETEAEEHAGIEVEDREVAAEDVAAKKRCALQLKMRRLAERLYPEEEAKLPSDKRCDKTYKPVPDKSSDSDSGATIPSIIFDDRGDEVIVIQTSQKRKQSQVNVPLVVSDSDSEGSAPGHIGAPARMALNHLPKEKRPHCKKQSKAHRDLSDGSDEDMGDSEGGAAMSDGESAL